MNRNILFALGGLVVLAGGGLVVWQSRSPAPPAPPPPAATAPVSPAPTATATMADATGVDAKALAPRKEGDDMVMGLDGAPVTIIEYASLTCPHCAHFNEATFPQLKAQYIDRGLVKYIYRDFPLDRMALRAAEIARCAGPDRYFAFVDVFFRQQMSWAAGKDEAEILGNLKKLARLGGMSDATFDSCLQDKSVEDAVLAQSLKGEQQYKVDSTPTLFINGEKHPGALSTDELDAALKPLLKKS